MIFMLVEQYSISWLPCFDFDGELEGRGVVVEHAVVAEGLGDLGVVDFFGVAGDAGFTANAGAGVV